MGKKLFSKKPKQNKTESEGSTSSVKKSRFFLKLMGWFAFLAVLGLGCFLLYPELASSQSTLSETEITTPPQQLIVKTPSVKPIEVKEEIAQNENKEPVVTVTTESLPLPSSATEQQEKIEVPQQQPVIVPEIEEPLKPMPRRLKFIKKSTSQYTVLQALDFKNAVLSHKNCRKHVETLLQVENPTDAMEKVILTFLPYCLHQDAERDDLNVFLAHKKQAILSIFQQKHSALVAYFYALPWLVMDIHKIQPTTDEAMDVLDRLHTAMLENDTESALIELDKLPPRVGAIFNDVRQELLEQQKRLSVLDELIISLTSKGE